jgi:predicted NBD/HSP70 family sugar kinase
MYLAVDVGGTKTLLASFEEDGTLVKEVRFPTPATYEAFLEDLQAHLPLLGVFTFGAAGVAIPGVIDRKTGVGISFGNLSWKNTPVKTDLEAIIECPVYVENDAKVGGLSEALLIKNEFKKVLYVPLGTGIGITYITDGVIDTNYGDRGGKDVKVTVNGQEIEWESIASGSAIKRQFGKQATDISDEASWKTIAHNLALGLAKVIEEKKPDAVVIGGGAGSHFERYGELLKQELTTLLQFPVPAILPAKHPEEAVIYGCIDLIKQHHGHTA